MCIRDSPDCVEQFAPLFWERNCYSPELQEYQRIAVLVSLDAMHSDLLPQYLERAKQDGRRYLLEHAKRIEGGLAMNEKLSRPQFNHCLLYTSDVYKRQEADLCLRQAAFQSRADFLGTAWALVFPRCQAGVLPQPRRCV